MTVTFNSGDTSNVTSASLYATVPITITGITIKGANSGLERTATLTVSDGSNRYDSEPIKLEAEEDFEINFPVNFTSNAEVSVSVYVTLSWVYPNSTQIFGGNVRSEEKIIAGSGAYITSANMFNCAINFSSAKTWGNGESGYIELLDNPLQMWTDWARDDDGYPYNATVWKIDDLNRKFPYIIPPYSYETNKNVVLVFSDSELILGESFIFTDDDLIPAQIKVMSGFE